MTYSERLLWASVFANGITATNVRSWSNNRDEVIRRASKLADEVLQAVDEVLTEDLDRHETKLPGLRNFMDIDNMKKRKGK